MAPLKIAVLLGAEPYQVYHAAGIAWELSERPGLEVEIVATLPETLAEFKKVSRTVEAKAIPARLPYDANERQTNTSIPALNDQPARNQNDPANPTDPTGAVCKGQ